MKINEILEAAEAIKTIEFLKKIVFGKQSGFSYSEIRFARNGTPSLLISAEQEAKVLRALYDDAVDVLVRLKVEGIEDENKSDTSAD